MNHILLYLVVIFEYTIQINNIDLDICFPSINWTLLTIHTHLCIASTICFGSFRGVACSVFSTSCLYETPSIVIIYDSLNQNWIYISKAIEDDLNGPYKNNSLLDLIKDTAIGGYGIQ